MSDSPTSPAASAEAPVLFSEREAAGGRRVGFARLNRARQLNALNLEMCRLLLDRLRDWAADESVACVVLEGDGDKGFCAGGDVASVVRAVRAGGPARFVPGDAFFDIEYQLDRLIHEYPKPFVAWMHGVTMGGGVGLAVGASHRIVSEGLKMAMPEIHIGLFPDVGGGWFLNRTPGGTGTVMALTGAIVDAADALFAGLADWHLPEAGRAATLDAILMVDWTGDARADRAMLSRLLAARAEAHAERLPESGLKRRFDAIAAIGRQPDAIGVRDALLEAARRDPWFETPARNLSQGSPTAAHVSFEYLRRARRLSLPQVLEMDLVLAKRFQRHHDFPEGVRALLIDKDRQPKWSPDRFDAVPRELVDAHFRPLDA